MNLQHFRSHISGFHNTVIECLRTNCLKCVPSCLRRHHQVHPIHLQYDNCEFLQLHPQRRIRVIHYNSQDESDTTDSSSANANIQDSTTAETNITNPHDPTLDEYWFVRGSHSSFRLFNKKKTKDNSSTDITLRKNSSRGPLDTGIRYSFHKRDKLKTCIEEDVSNIIDTSTNQIKTLDSFISNLVSVIIEEAIIVHQKHQRNQKISNSVECQPSKLLHNGITPSNKSEHSGCNNVGFVSDGNSRAVELRKEGEEDSGTKIQDSETKKETKKSQAKKNSSKQPSKPLLLFLHGAGGSAEEWSSVLTYFAAAGYEIVAPDLLGHGLSSAPHSPKAYTFACLLQDALQIFDTFAPEPRKCVVIGHGYGCSFAAAVARYRPHSVVQLILISGGGPTPLAPHRGIYSLPRFLLGCAKPLLLCGFRREYFYAPRGKQLMFGDHLDVPSYVWSHMYQGQEWPQGDTAFHRRISVPTLLVHGMNDPHITLVEECEMERTIPRSFLEILPGAGHKAMLDAPQPLCHMLHCFITLWDKSGALSK